MLWVSLRARWDATLVRLILVTTCSLLLRFSVVPQTLTKRQEAELEVTELKMLRFSLGVTRMDKIRNEYIRGTAQVGKFGEKTQVARHDMDTYGGKMMGILGEGC